MRKLIRNRLKRRRFEANKLIKRQRYLQRKLHLAAGFRTRSRRTNAAAHPIHWNLAAPTVFSLMDKRLHQIETAFLAKLREAFVTRTRPVCIDFSHTTKLFPEGMLLFYAELNRLISVYPEVQISCVPAMDATVDGVLQHLGIYGCLNHHSSAEPAGAEVVGWKKAYATLVEGEAFGTPIENLGLASTYTRKLYEGVSEAVTNVLNHAHLADRRDGLHLSARKEWWMFIHESDHRLYVAVCDLGIGIPRSLPRQHGKEAVLHAIRVMFGRKRATDGRMIQAALRLRRSRTDAGHRGMGFTDMIAVLNAIPDSRMIIFSNHGALEYKASHQPPVLRVHTFKNSILGTIVAWSFPRKGNES